MKIGLPKALLFYYYYPFWKCLLEELGFEVVVSDDTNTHIIEEGTKVTVSEICVPIKIFNGHVLNLLEKDVDYILIPRFISMGKDEWYCPKFIGLVELEKYSVYGQDSKMLYLDIRSENDLLTNPSIYQPLCDTCGVTKKDLRRAIKKASAVFEQFRALSLQGYTLREASDIIDGKKIPLPPKEAEVTIALMGYVYNIYDNFVSMNAVTKLREMGVRVITFDMLPPSVVDKKAEKNEGKVPFWVYSRKVYRAAMHLFDMPETDGVIHMTAFGCGPDSIIGKLMEVKSEETDKPFMYIRVDEHTGESHVQTRFEAFVDMLKTSKAKAMKETKKGSQCV